MASIGSSTSTNNNTLTNLTAKTGIGGLVSGMDIDELVESLSATSRQKIIKQQQNVQRLEWKQTAYRSVTKALKEFQSKYLDVLSPTNFRSTSMFNTIKAVSSSDAVTVSSTAKSAAGTITINSITRLATAQKIEMADGATASKPLTASKNLSAVIEELKAGSISMTLDGKVKTITFDSNFIDGLDSTNFETRLQSLIDNAFGASSGITVNASNADGPISFQVAAGSKLVLNSVGESTALTEMGFQSGQSNTLNTNAALGDLTLKTGLTEATQIFKINDVTFRFSNTDTLASIMQKINSSDAGVTISYSSITDRFTMTAKETGAGNNINITEYTGNLMTALGLTDDAGAKMTPGENALLTVNGQPISRSSNSFEIDGTKITLNKTTDVETKLTLTEDATSLTDTIKKFVEDYNSMIDLINGLIKEEVFKDYPPLSDAQKEEMTESEITAWEKKAKSGILRGDNLLRSITSKLQSVVTGLSVNGMSLYSMGISTSGYLDNGKLKIDETKLKTALETKGSEIREFFTSEKGLGNALNEVILGATKTSGVKGTRGSLIEAAGMDNTTSNTENSIYEQIKRINKNIKTLKIKLEDEESRLWSKFTYMETIISNLNSQSAMLSGFTNY